MEQIPQIANVLKANVELETGQRSSSVLQNVKHVQADVRVMQCGLSDRSESTDFFFYPNMTLW